MVALHNERLQYRFCAEQLNSPAPCFTLQIEDEVLSRLEWDSAQIDRMKKTFGFKEFRGDVARGARFGFDKVMHVSETYGPGREIRIPIPVMQEADGLCEECSGEGAEDGDPELDDCIRCNGTGKQHRPVHQQAQAISATFTVLLEKLRQTRQPTTNQPLVEGPYQLFHVKTMTVGGLNGSSLSGEFSVPLVGWLRLLANLEAKSELQLISDAMQAAYRLMFPFSCHDYFAADFQANVQRSGWFGLTCPGNGCCLTPNHAAAFTVGYGYSFTGHNVDAPYQQILYLIALARLSDMAASERIGQ
jgi:hypothetical protein